MGRQESIDKLYAKQQAIREQRQKNKKLRLKAAQQRQWDEQKYLKQTIDKLENEEKQCSKDDLKQWVDEDIDDEKDEKKESQNEMPAIRQSNVIEIGHSDWDYI